jgi:hypothetical protein
MTNEELAQRADFAIGNLTSNSGLLNPEQANRFIDIIQEQPTILQQVRTIRMNAPTRKINRLGFASRILRAASQGTPPSQADDGTNDRYLPAADRSSPTTTQIQLDTKEVIAEIRLPYEVLEDNLEREDFDDHVMRLIAERAAEDLEELALGGDVGSGDAYLALVDGYLKQMTSNVYDNTSSGINPDVFEQGMLTMPQKYLRNLKRLRHYVSVANTIKYRSEVAKRTTGYGDSMLTSDGELFAYGVQVEAASMLGADSGVTNGIDQSGFFTFPQNMIFGIQRQIQVETDRDIRSREHVIVLTARIDFKLDDEPACVKYTNISA